LKDNSDKVLLLCRMLQQVGKRLVADVTVEAAKHEMVVAIL
jgi:hypothetical protein